MTCLYYVESFVFYQKFIYFLFKEDGITSGVIAHVKDFYLSHLIDLCFFSFSYHTTLQLVQRQNPTILAKDIIYHRCKSRILQRYEEPAIVSIIIRNRPCKSSRVDKAIQDIRGNIIVTRMRDACDCFRCPVESFE